MRHELSAGNTLIIRGPASFTLLAGHASILGAPIQPNAREVIESHRQLPLETENGAELELALGKNGDSFEVQGSTIPESWRQAAAALGEIREGKGIIVGATDVGKSTLCTYLVNSLLHTNDRVFVVDADIGQADLGPPTTIARAIPTRPITSLSQLAPDRRLFIGDTSPSSVMRELTQGIQRLLADTDRSLTIINTEGWIAEPAAAHYKTQLIGDVAPNLVLGITNREELQPILNGIRSPSMKVDAAKEILQRSRTDRKEIRGDGYRKALEGAAICRVPIRSVKISVPTGFPAVTAKNSHWLRNLIVGLLDETGYLLQFGILSGVEQEALRVYCRPSPTARRIQLGHVKLSNSGSEIGFM